jgi:hypothetical protein
MSELEDIIEQETRRIHGVQHLNQGFQRFYTYPPVECEHPWILRKIGNKEMPCTHEIVDIGIYDLMNEAEAGGHSEKKLKAWKQLKPNGWKVVPDCPDLEREFNLEVICLNTAYSWELLNEYFNPDDDTHLPVIQSQYGDINSFKCYIRDFKREYGEHNQIGIGSIFKADTDFAVRMLKIARREFPNSWIHAFGLKFKHFLKVRQVINSFDGTGWTRDIKESGKSSARNKLERIHYFNKYMNRLNEVMYPYNKNQLKLEV